MSDMNRKVAALFQSMADFLEVKRENPHRIRAYRRGAESVLALKDDVDAVARRGGLRDIAGIGKDLAAKIEEFIQTGSIQAYEELTRPLPSDIAEWIALPGLTDVAVQYLYFRLGIASLEDLEALIRSHLLRTLPGVIVQEEQLLTAITILKAQAKAAEKRDDETSSTPSVSPRP